MKRMEKQKGFTIIELVVVILLLGILTATALPRFMDVSTQAHTAVVQGVQGSLQTAVALYNAAWTAEGQPAADTAVAGFGDGTLQTNGSGYPKSEGAGDITDDVAGASECAAIYAELLQVGGVPSINATGIGTVPTAAALNGEANDFLAYVTDAGVCNFAYAAEAVVGTFRNLQYDSVAGTIVLQPAVAVTP